MSLGDIEALRSSPSFLVLNEKWQLIMELCHFTQEINPLWTTESLSQQLKAISRPAIQKITGKTKEDEVFKSLIDSFFTDCRFACTKGEPQSLQALFLPCVLNARSGPTPLLMLLLTAWLEEAGIRTQIISCQQRHLFKVRIFNHWKIFDFENNCQVLTPEDLLDLVNQGFQFSSGKLGSEAMVIAYLNRIKGQARKENQTQALAMTHSYLMRYQPFNLRHLRGRAHLAYETGDYRRAVDDIRSYFQYKPSDFTNAPLRRLYKLALRQVRSQ